MSAPSSDAGGRGGPTEDEIKWKAACDKLRRKLRGTGERLVVTRGNDPQAMIVDTARNCVVVGPAAASIDTIERWTEDPGDADIARTEA